MNEIIWRGMTRAQLDTAYNNTAAVRNSADKLADWIERSKRVRAERSELLDLVSVSYTHLTLPTIYSV